MMTKVKQIIYTFRREILIFLLLFFTLLCQLPDEIHAWNSAWYAMDYSLGFDSRLFIGSFLRLFYPNFLPAGAAYTFVLLSFFLLLILLAHVLGYALRFIVSYYFLPPLPRFPFLFMDFRKHGQI